MEPQSSSYSPFLIGKHKILVPFASSCHTPYLNMINYMDIRSNDMAQGAKNLLGRIFGKLTPIEYAGSEITGSNTKGKWKCKCECGNETIVFASNLLRNHTKSCGCIRSYSKDHIGEKFWKLLVVQKINIPNRRGAFYVCKCDCGNETVVQASHLRAGTRKSCGCKSYENVLENGTFRLYTIYKERSKISFEISYEFFKECIKNNCFYCGNPPQGKRKNCEKGPVLEYNGIDRKDSLKGYTEENCVTCCKYCNLSKSNSTIKEWFDHMKKIFRHSGVSL